MKKEKQNIFFTIPPFPQQANKGKTTKEETFESNNFNRKNLKKLNSPEIARDEVNESGFLILAANKNRKIKIKIKNQKTEI